jgi:hypothetical protein
VPFADFGGLEPWSARPDPVPVARPPEDGQGAGRDEIRRLILDELRELVGR